MDSLRPNLICTVGTSLFIPNLKFLNPETQPGKWANPKDPTVQADRAALSRQGLWADQERLVEVLQNIKKFYETKEEGLLADQLQALPPDLRLCGAEINSIEAMIRKEFMPEQRGRMILLVSETPDGESIGKILKAYFENQRCGIGFAHCEYVTVGGLQDEDPPKFQQIGLTNLVRWLGEYYRRYGGAVAINATGGYKAQIALAVAFGQATGCPVYYKHERFDQIIRFPQVPFTLDLTMVSDHLKFWAELAEPGASFEETDLKRLMPDFQNFFETIYPMLDEIEEGKDRLYGLSALGMVYWEAFKSLNQGVTLKPAPVTTRKGCHFPEHHYSIDFRDYVKRVYEAFPEMISECHSLPHSGQRGINQNRFYLKQNRILGEYVDRNNFGARFEIMTAATNELERLWVIEQLENWLKNR
jgi:putative CRISPR-associated protein (TIGR02619 family)